MFLFARTRSFQYRGRKVFIVAYSPSNLSEEELSYRDALLSGFLTNQGAIVVDKESDAECIAISVFKDIKNRQGKSDTTYLFPRYMKTSKIEPDRKVLYITPEIHSYLSHFLGRLRLNDSKKLPPKRSPINEGGLYTLAGYIPVHEGHWGGYWHLQSMPIVYSIEIKDNGYELDLRTSWYSGETAFVDKAMKIMTYKGGWIE